MQTFFRNASPVVGNLKNELMAFALKTNPCGRCARVTMDVRQAFLQDAKQHQFTMARGTLELVRDFAAYLDSAALGESLYEPSCGRCDAGLVQNWRMQKIGSSSDFLQGVIGEDVEIIEQPGKIPGRRLAEQGERHLHGREGLAGGVVKFA